MGHNCTLSIRMAVINSTERQYIKSRMLVNIDLTKCLQTCLVLVPTKISFIEVEDFLSSLFLRHRYSTCSETLIMCLEFFR